MDSELTLQQEMFCQYYINNDALFGNATLSYAEAYDYKLDELSTEKPVLANNADGTPTEWGDSEYTLAYNTCSACSSKLLRNNKINERVKKLLNELLKDEEVDAELARIIKNGKDSDKISAIKEYNALKQRIVKKTETDITSKGEKITGIELIVPDVKDNPQTHE